LEVSSLAPPEGMMGRLNERSTGCQCHSLSTTERRMDTKRKYKMKVNQKRKNNPQPLVGCVFSAQLSWMSASHARILLFFFVRRKNKAINNKLP